MSSLSEMPGLVMEIIIGFLNFRSVLTLRQVCKDFLNFIDKLHNSKLPDSGFLKIEVILNKDICIVYDDPYRIRHEFIYSGSDNSRSFNGKTISLKNSNIVDVAILDLEQVLKFQKSTLIEFHCLDHQPTNGSTFLNFHIKLSNILERLNRKIKTKELSVTLGSQSGFMLILPFVDPEDLEQLNLRTMDNKMQIEIDEIVKTEQWKNAKKIHCNFYALNMTVEDISHLQRFNGKMPLISVRDLNFLKKTITSSSKFEYSWLDVKNFNEYEEISNIWGPPFYFGSASRWYFQMKNSEENILGIGILQDYNHFFFDKIKMREVPDGATIHDYNENQSVYAP
ncbi:hypothetical protein B9Z55_021285 [Caenorhabditis nigoni]|uniref:F-box domain-containing protein n=1 Tax=Caenorhabditis nigoni TaxID=1611254 RepID=A0A2G5TRA1_9PELO|nr:hypothetical protein B9Z55_021285 [Caenorhabditis nigoni]